MADESKMVTTIEDLPNDLLEIILRDPDITILEAWALCSSTRRLQQMFEHNTMWKLKFKREYSHIKNFQYPDDWYSEVRYLMQLRRRLDKLLEEMPKKYIHLLELEDKHYAEWLKISRERRHSYDYMTTHLQNYVSNAEIDTELVVPYFSAGNSTLIFYILKVLRYLRKITLVNEWKRLQNLPEEEKLYEKMAVFIEQWCQPELNIDYDEVSDKLDRVCDKILERVKEIKPHHPIFSVSKEQKELWKKKNLDKNQYPPLDSRHLMGLIKNTMTQHLKYVGNCDDLRCYNARQLFIDHVLDNRTGTSLLLGVIYTAVARRMGINFILDNDGVNDYYTLKFQESNGSNGYITMDPFFEQLFVQNILPQHKPTFEEIGKAICKQLQTVVKITPTLSRLNILELAHTIHPDDISVNESLAKELMRNKMDVTEFEKKLLELDPVVYKDILDDLKTYKQTKEIFAHEWLSDEQKKLTPIKHDPNVKYPIGMILQHMVGTMTGVICDWHTECIDIERYNIDGPSLRHGYKQPFYVILAHDGTYKYVAQENVEPTIACGKLLRLADLCRYFSHYHDGHFVPNTFKDAQYPEDSILRIELHKKKVAIESYYNLRRINF